MSTHNLKNFKLSKVLVKDLTNILRIMRDYEIKLLPFKKYVPISKLINNSLENRKIVEYHLAKQKKVLYNKGKIEEEQKLLENKK